VIEVVVRWRGGAGSRQEVYQGLRRYADLAGFDTLRWFPGPWMTREPRQEPFSETTPVRRDVK
jgi:hypothetical protein